MGRVGRRTRSASRRSWRMRSASRGAPAATGPSSRSPSCARSRAESAIGDCAHITGQLTTLRRALTKPCYSGTQGYLLSRAPQSVCFAACARTTRIENDLASFRAVRRCVLALTLLSACSAYDPSLVDNIPQAPRAGVQGGGGRAGAAGQRSEAGAGAAGGGRGGGGAGGAAANGGSGSGGSGAGGSGSGGSGAGGSGSG